MHIFIKNEIQKSQNILTEILASDVLLKKTEEIAKRCIHSVKNSGKIMFAGNGGSAADSQHLAAELMTRLSFNRPGIAAIALTTDTSALTAIGNDYSFEDLFARQVETIGQKGDVFIGISTSGKSSNVLKALEAARTKGLITIGLTGQIAPLMTERCDVVLNIPSKNTQKIQECHILFGHIICALVEEALYGTKYNAMEKAIDNKVTLL